MMQTYEFFATPENGSITIPEQYRKKITSRVKVILLEEKAETTTKEPAALQKSDLLLPPDLNTKGWKVNREEANER